MKGFGDNNTCELLLSSAMNQFKTKGLRRNSHFFSISGGSTPVAPATMTDLGIPAGIRSSLVAAQPNLIENTNPVALRNPLLLNDTMAALTSIYNSNPASYCQNADGAPLPNDANFFTPPENVHQLNNLAINIRIRPLNLFNKTALPNCPSPLIPMPKGIYNQVGFPNVTNPITGPNPAFQFAPEYRPDLGWEVTLRGQYEGRDRQIETCSLQTRVDYPVDSGAQATFRPSVIVTSNVSVSDSNVPYINYPAVNQPRAQCSHNPGVDSGRFTLQLGFLGANRMEPGSVLLCRDTSVQIVGSWCEGAAGASQVPSGLQPNIATSPWVPCDQVTACGIRPSGSTLTTGGNYEQDVFYSLTYDSTDMWGCDIRIDQAMVDSSGNFFQSTASNQAQIFFRAAPCYNCVTRKRRGFFSGVLCFFAVQVGIGQKGGCKGRSFTSCSNQSGGRTRCSPQPERFPAANGLTCPATSGSFNLQGQPYQGANWSLPVGQSGQTEIVQWKSSDTQIMCEKYMECAGNGQWTEMIDPNNPEPECRRIYTQITTPVDTGGGVASGTPTCVLQGALDGTTIPDPANPGFDIPVEKTVPTITGYDPNTGDALWSHYVWYADGVIDQSVADTPCIPDP